MRRSTSVALAALVAFALLSWGRPSVAQIPPTQCTSSALAGGTSDALTIPTLPCSVTTTLLLLKLSATNLTTTPTLQMVGAPAQRILRADGSAPAIGELVGGSIILVTNNGTNWITLVNDGAFRDLSNLILPTALQGLGLQIPATCDNVHSGSGNITAGSKNFSSPQGNLTQAAVGKPISIEGAGAAGATYLSTIASVTDSTDAVLTDPAGTTVTNASFAYGTIYTALIQTAINSGIPFHLPPKGCGIDATLHLPNNTTFGGYGGSPYFPPTSALLWISNNPGPALSVDTGSNAHDINISDFTIFGMCSLDTGAMIKGMNQSTWNSIHVLDTTNIGFHFDISADGNFDNGNLTFNKLQAGVQNACAHNQRGIVVEPGNAFHDFTRSRFTDLLVQNMDGTGLDLYGINSTAFVNTRILNALGGAGKSIEFHGAAASPMHAHATYWFGLEASNVIQSDDDVQPANDNFVWGYDVSTFPVNVSNLGAAKFYCVTTLPGGDPGNGCSSWKLFANSLKMDNSAGTAGITGNTPSSGVILSGGVSLVAGGRLELYGSTFGIPNSAYLDTDRFTIRKADTTGTMFDLNTVAGTATFTGHFIADSASDIKSPAYILDNTGGTATILTNHTNSGFIASGGNSVNDGANFELYGSTFATPNSAFLDSDEAHFRTQDGSVNRFSVGAGSGSSNGGVTVGSPTGGQKGIGTINTAIASFLNGSLLFSATAPTVASGGCTTGSAQSISQSNGSAAFEITLGGATCGSTITLTMPAAPHNWVCDAHDITNPAGNVLDMTGTASTTAVVLTNFVRTTGVAGNFTGADKLAVKCLAY